MKNKILFNVLKVILMLSICTVMNEIPARAASPELAGVPTPEPQPDDSKYLDWDLVDSGKHLDWSGDSQYSNVWLYKCRH